ncbi:hypothetical protein GCM10010232_34760 [Streptomyces amakusaensis]
MRAAGDIEHRPDRAPPYRARVRWFDPASKRRRSLSEGKDTHDEAEDWISGILKAAKAGIAPDVATMSLAEYGTGTMDLALRGLEPKTLDPYLFLRGGTGDGWPGGRLVPVHRRSPIAGMAGPAGARPWPSAGRGRARPAGAPAGCSSGGGVTPAAAAGTAPVRPPRRRPRAAAPSEAVPEREAVRVGGGQEGVGVRPERSVQPDHAGA